ncbi:MAG: transposase [Pseudomonadales bacterium]
MTYPRSHLVDDHAGGCYHVVSRCVRRAWLCGRDASTGRNFEHRRRWIEDRIHELSKVFAVSIYSYAVMSDHYHMVLAMEPQLARTWTDEEVAGKWLSIYPGRKPRKPDSNVNASRKAALIADPVQLAKIRHRLGSLSWLMRSINERLARWANEEDGCTGRFWEGRFSSQVLLDDNALLACMVYVDLNPVRAGLANDLADSKHTSVRHRISLQASSQMMNPLNGSSDDRGILPDLTVADYLDIVRWTAESQSDYRRGIKLKCPDALTTRDLDAEVWISEYLPRPHHWQRAVGRKNALQDHARNIGQRWIKRCVKIRSGRQHPDPFTHPPTPPRKK